jgi:type III pantothenate kinase
MAGAVERMYRKLREHTGAEPVLLMSGGAAPKLSAITDLRFDTVESLIFDGLLVLQAERMRLSAPAAEDLGYRI